MQYMYQLAENVESGKLQLEDLFGLIEYAEIEILYARIADVEDEEKFESVLAFVMRNRLIVSPQLVSKLLTSSHLTDEQRKDLFSLFLSKVR